MFRVVSKQAGRGRRGLALSLAWLLVWSQACWLPPKALPQPGSRASQAEAVREIGPIRVHLANGNVSLDRVDLSLDTRVGVLEHGAVWNSASGEWLWRHEVHYRDGLFVDETGARHEIAALPDGAAIPGTHWIKLDAVRVRTKGGRVHVFDPATGGLLETRWADGPFPVLRYARAQLAGASLVSRIDQCVDEATCSEQLRFVRDAAGCIVEAHDRAGRVADYVVDAWCRPFVARDGLAVQHDWTGVRYEYGAAGRVRARVSSEGERVEVDYREGRVAAVRQLGEANVLHRFGHAYDPQTDRSLTHMTTPLGATWRYEFDGAGRMLRRVSPEGDVMEQGWAGARPAWRRDASGATWTFQYQDDELVRAVDPLGHVTLFVPAPQAVDRSNPLARPISRIHDTLGLREQRDFDAFGRVTTRIDGVGDVTRFEWDELGQLIARVEPDGRRTTFHDYGEHGHATRIERGELVEVRLFDAVGNLEKGEGTAGEIAPGRPGLIRRRFDAGRHVSEIWTTPDHSNASTFSVSKTLVEVRSDGRPTRIERPYGGVIEFDYDALGRVVARRDRVDGQWRTTSLDVDLEGRTTRVVRPNGMTAEFEWDRDGRVIAVQRTHAGAPDEQVAFTWQGGRVARIDDVAHPRPEWLEYDGAGRVVRVAHATGGETAFDWDGRGRLRAKRVRGEPMGPVLFEVTRSFDAADRLERTELDGELLVQRHREAGRVVTEVFGNGLARSYVHDEATGELNRSIMKRGIETVAETTIDRSACWTDKLCIYVTSSADVAAEGEPPLWRWAEEHYQMQWPEQMNGDEPMPGPRLRFASANPILLPGDGDALYFDAVGNLSGFAPKGGYGTGFVFNAERNRLLTGGLSQQHTYAYDEAGFVTERDGKPLGWTASGLIASIGDDVAFEWDGLGRPRSRRSGPGEVRFGFGGSVVVDELGWPIQAEIDGVRVALGATSRRYLHRDFRGNVQLVSDEDGRIVRQHIYDPFGTRWVNEAEGEPRAPEDGEHGFAGGLHVAGLQMLGARIYDPEVARFLSPDPVPHVLNDFAYTTGDPVRFWDPGGTEAVGTPGAGELPGLTPQGQASITTGRMVEGLGRALVQKGFDALQPQTLGLGVVLFVLGMALQSLGKQMRADSPSVQPAPDTPSPDVEASAPEVASSTCAPENLTPRRVGPGRIALLAFAFLLALGLSRPRRRGVRA